MNRKTLLFAALLSLIMISGEVFASDHGRHGERSYGNAEFYGVIEKMPERGGEGTWTIGGRKVFVDQNTFNRANRRYGKISPGQFVEVKCRKEGEKYHAYKIEVKGDRRHGSGYTRAKFYGIIEMMPKSGLEGKWKVNGRTINVTPRTRIEEEYGKAVTGAYVEVKGGYSGNSFIAYKIEVKRRRR